MSKQLDVTSKRFGNLIAIKSVGKGKDGILWQCVCDCGNTRLCRASDLRAGKNISCGCKRGKPPGLSVAHGKRSRPNRIWKQMRQRCLNKNDSAYDRYGGRGIRICPEWSDFKVFHAWAISHGYTEDLEIDRRDNSKGYFPENCRWVDLKTQARNKKNNHLITFNGKTLPMAQWTEEMGFKPWILSNRIHGLGWSPEKALTQTVRPLCRKK